MLVIVNVECGVILKRHKGICFVFEGKERLDRVFFSSTLEDTIKILGKCGEMVGRRCKLRPRRLKCGQFVEMSRAP